MISLKLCSFSDQTLHILFHSSSVDLSIHVSEPRFNEKKSFFSAVIGLSTVNAGYVGSLSEQPGVSLSGLLVQAADLSKREKA